MPQQQAFLVVHKMALFNDEWYDDFTLEVQGVNPAGLFTSRAEAEAAAHAWTRDKLRGSTFDDLEVDEDTDERLAELVGQPGDLDADLAKALPGFASRRHPLPATLTDAQLDGFLQRTGLRMYHVIEADVDEFEVKLAQSLLALTPQRPNIDLEFQYDEDNDDARTEVIETSDDPAVERLNRITALFGRQYANGIPM